MKTCTVYKRTTGRCWTKPGWYVSIHRPGRHWPSCYDVLVGPYLYKAAAVRGVNELKRYWRKYP